MQLVIRKTTCSYNFSSQACGGNKNISCNKNKKPLTVHNKEKQINLKMCKLIYIRCFFVVVYLFIENTGRAHNKLVF